MSTGGMLWLVKRKKGATLYYRGLKAAVCPAIGNKLLTEFYTALTFHVQPNRR